MTRFTKQRLAADIMPDAWKAEMGRATRLLSLDAFAGKDGVEVILRPEATEAAFLRGLTFTLDGTEMHPTARPVPRGTHLRFDGLGSKLTISGHGIQRDLDIAPQNDWFVGRNVVFAVISRDRPRVLRDWLVHLSETQNANAVLLIQRLTPSEKPLKLNRIGDIPGIHDIVLATIDVPVGSSKQGDAQARHNAPDAPGKAMLPPLEKDPWRSQLSETALLEVARQRFLRQARAVLFASPSDLLPHSGQSVFDAAAMHGLIRFDGVRAYPYALSNPKKPSHADHNCRAFDGGRAEPIWCAAPMRLPDTAFWRLHRLAETEPAAESANYSYYRCMALRHPGLKVGELVPKTSLVEDHILTALVRDQFDGTPKAPPAPAEAMAGQLRNDRILIVTTMKNEGPFILDWLAWHRSIGVTDFLVYTNDCTDGTDVMFDLLQRKNILQHRENPYRKSGEKPQHAAYHDASETELARDVDWTICMDVDEYINIHVGDGTLSALFNAVPEANLWSLTWRLFGNADIAPFEDRPITEQFFHCAPEMIRKPHQAWGFKTLFRNAGHYKKFGVHRPKGLRPEYLDAIHWVNGSGQKMPDDILRTGWRSNASTFGYDLVTLNHYALRSAESFLVKRDRGRVNHVDRDQGMNYWFRMNHNPETDRRILTHRDRFHAERAALMADPEIAKQHAACVAAHRARIVELKERPDYASFYRDITGERLRGLSRVLHHFGTDVFLQGPDAIPDGFDWRMTG